MRPRFASILVPALVAASWALPARGDLVFELNHEFSGSGFNPAGPAPWGTATFQEIANGDIQLTMQADLTVASEKITSWYFNFVSDLLAPNQVDVTYNSGQTGTANRRDPAGTQGHQNSFKADGDGRFDFRFDFPQAGDTFSLTETSVWTFGHDTVNLTLAMFDQLSVGGGNFRDGLPHAAHIQGLGQDGAGSGFFTVIPAPASMLLGVLGVVMATMLLRR